MGKSEGKSPDGETSSSTSILNHLCCDLLSVIVSCFGVVVSDESYVESKEEVEKFQKFRVQRMNILREFLETERYYVENLRVLKNYFVVLIQQRKLLPEKSVKTIFGESQTILGVNELFLKDLESILTSSIDGQSPNSTNRNQQDTDKASPRIDIQERQPLISGNDNSCEEKQKVKGRKRSESFSKESQISDMILQFAQAFKLYSGYISNYSASIEHLSMCRTKHPKFSTFLEEQKQKLKSEGRRIIGLSDYTILPIQRIPRYRLLLQDLLKHFPNKTAKHKQEYEKLERAVKLVGDIAAYCNEKEREYQRTLHVYKLQQTVIGLQNCLIEPGRKFIREICSCTLSPSTPQSDVPPVQKIGSSGNPKPCDLYLFNNMLLCVGPAKRTSILSNSKSKPIEILFSQDMPTVIPYVYKASGGAVIGGGGANLHGFEIKYGENNQTLTIIFGSESTAKEWIEELKMLLKSSTC